MGCYSSSHVILSTQQINLILMISGSNKRLTSIIKKEYIQQSKSSELSKLDQEAKDYYKRKVATIDHREIEKIYHTYIYREYKNSNLKIGKGYTAYSQPTLEKMFKEADPELEHTYFKIDRVKGIIWYLNDLDSQNIIIYKFTIVSPNYNRFKNGFYLIHDFFLKT